MRYSVRRRAQHRFNRLTGIDNERGSITILLMVVLVGMMLSAMIIPVIITQDRTTRFDTTRVQALNAAESGIDVTIGLIRSSVSAATNIGESTKLPCGPLSGTVNTTGIAAYSVGIEYFTADPLQPVKAGDPSPLLQCDPRYGPYQQASSGNPGGTVTPKFARLTSTGTVGAAINGSTAGRTLTSTYKFKTADTNFPGGVIRVNPVSASDAPLCMDVGSATPAAGTAVMLQNCSTSNPPAPPQVFAYRTDLTLQLASTAPSNGVNGCDRTTPTNCGLCLNTSATPALAGNAIQLSACGPLGSPATYTQTWSYNDGNPAQYQAANATSASKAPTPGTNDNLPNLCITTAGPSAGTPLIVGSCTGGAQAWIPSPSVGAGAATLPQWVNFSEFGRCLDVAYEQVINTHMFDFPCKQNPYPGAVRWNQKFQAPPILTGSTSATGQMSTTVPPGAANPGTYCLTSPTSSLNANTIYDVTMQACGNSSLQTWTVYGGDKSLPYSDKYRIKFGDQGGLYCLGLGAPYGNDQWSAIVVEPCTSATDQKWNANPSVLSSSQKDTKEK